MPINASQSDELVRYATLANTPASEKLKLVALAVTPSGLGVIFMMLAQPGNCQLKPWMSIGTPSQKLPPMSGVKVVVAMPIPASTGSSASVVPLVTHLGFKRLRSRNVTRGPSK